MRRYPYQHMHMVAIDRSSVDGHLVRPRDFPQQLPRPLPDIAAQHRKSVLCDPHDMILAVPDRVTAGLRILHTGTVASQSPKGEGFTDPKGGTLNSSASSGESRYVTKTSLTLAFSAAAFDDRRRAKIGPDRSEGRRLRAARSPPQNEARGARMDYRKEFRVQPDAKIKLNKL